jgi:hypothetical protein
VGLVLILCLVAAIMVMALWFQLLNADLYGRLTETQRLGNIFGATDDDPTIRLVLHRLLSDENAVEASVILTLSSAKREDFKKQGNTRLRARVYDASFQPFGMGGFITLDLVSPEDIPDPGLNVISQQSNRFMLPLSPSLEGFPFDDRGVRVFTELRGTRSVVYAHLVEVEKMIPGRLLRASLNNGAVNATLTRTSTEKFLTITGAMVFLIVTLVIAWKLFMSTRALTGLEEVLAMAGYIVGAAGFRDLLGISRAAGGSTFEVVTLGVPLMALAVGLVMSTLRATAHRSRSKS